MASQIHTLMQWAQSELKEECENPALDVEILLSELLEIPRTHVSIQQNLSLDDEKRFREWIALRKVSQPIQFITGRAYFRNLTLSVGEGVLIPRPESEQIVDWVKEAVSLVPAPRIVDLGAGSGALAISLATEMVDAHVATVEKSESALAWLKKNVAELAPGIEIVASDVELFDGEQRFDAVIANPPYIPHGESLPRDVLAYEPEEALFGGAEGWEIPQRFIASAARALKSGGVLALEHHESHGEKIKSLLSHDFTEVTLHYDFNARPRWSTGVRK